MERHIEYKDDRFDVSLTVRSARQIDATRRYIWQANALEAGYADPIKLYDAGTVYPNLCAPIDESTARFVVDGLTLVWPLSCDQFMNLPALPDGLFVPWWDAAHECNDTWWAKPTAEDVEKKAPKSTNGSPDTILTEKSAASESSIPTA